MNETNCMFTVIVVIFIFLLSKREQLKCNTHQGTQRVIFFSLFSPFFFLLLFFFYILMTRYEAHQTVSIQT